MLAFVPGGRSAHLWLDAPSSPYTSTSFFAPTKTRPATTVGIEKRSAVPARSRDALISLLYNSRVTSLASYARNTAGLSAPRQVRVSIAHTIPFLPPLDETTGVAPGSADFVGPSVGGYASRPPLIP